MIFSIHRGHKVKGINVWKIAAVHHVHLALLRLSEEPSELTSCGRHAMSIGSRAVAGKGREQQAVQC